MNQVTQIVSQVVSDQSEHEGYPNSGYQLYSMACNYFKVSSLDITHTFDFKKAYDVATGEELFAYYAIAILQARLYASMFANDLGPDALTEPAAAAMRVWEWKLRDKILAERHGQPVRHTWMH